ncbi:MAG TPA: hypothetical protein VG897_10965 [Terriglobales bacterium]|nr:hypothetical protein [Terriglobales bacterium]
MATSSTKMVDAQDMIVTDEPRSNQRREDDRASAIAKSHDQLLKDCLIMFDYALEEGLEIDPAAAAAFNLIDREEPLTTQSASELIPLHNSLARTVAPATPCSLRATAPAGGSLAFLRHPPVIGSMVLAAVICACGFVIAISQKWQTVSWVSGAGLGAAFYGLFTAHDYVKRRTFDPRYNSV